MPGTITKKQSTGTAVPPQVAIDVYITPPQVTIDVYITPIYIPTAKWYHALTNNLSETVTFETRCYEMMRTTRVRDAYICCSALAHPYPSEKDAM